MALPVAWLNNLGAWLMERFWPLSIELAVLTVVVAAIVYGLRVRSPALRPSENGNGTARRAG